MLGGREVEQPGQLWRGSDGGPDVAPFPVGDGSKEGVVGIGSGQGAFGFGEFEFGYPVGFELGVVVATLLFVVVFLVRRGVAGPAWEVVIGGFPGPAHKKRPRCLRHAGQGTRFEQPSFGSGVRLPEAEIVVVE